MSRRPARSGGRDFPRTARVNELLREILGEALETVDDERLEWVTITAVHVDRDLRHAAVYFDTLEGPDDDAAVMEAFASLRVRLQATINRQAHLRRTPELSFAPDPAVRGGERIDEVLRHLHDDDAGSP